MEINKKKILKDSFIVKFITVAEDFEFLNSLVIYI